MTISMTNFNSRFINGEEFAYIPGYDNYYISKSGKLLGRNGKLITERLIGSYKGYQVYINGKSTSTFTHKLLALAWIPLPDGYEYSDVTNSFKAHTLVVDHKDGDKLNNDISNLRWLSSYDNINAGNYEKRIGALKGNQNAKGKKPSICTCRYYYLYEGSYYDMQGIMKKLNCSKSKITTSFAKNIGLVRAGKLTRVPREKIESQGE